VATSFRLDGVRGNLRDDVSPGNAPARDDQEPSDSRADVSGPNALDHRRGGLHTAHDLRDCGD
jgi:hypothetical protein